MQLVFVVGLIGDLGDRMLAIKMLSDKLNCKGNIDKNPNNNVNGNNFLKKLELIIVNEIPIIMIMFRMITILE